VAKSKVNIPLRILFFSLALIVVSAGAVAWWFSHHYETVLKERLPGMMLRATDSVYHISFQDLNVNVFDHKVTITGLELWADEKQALALKQQHRHTPPTLSTLSISLLEVTGINWHNIISDKSIESAHASVQDLKWTMDCSPNPKDSLYSRDKKKPAAITSITCDHVDFINPDITYHYKGIKEHFDCYMKGGTATLENFAYDMDEKKDTSVFLYARSGKVRFKDFIFSKPAGRYVINAPLLDFVTTPNTVTLRSVKITNMRDLDQKTGKEKEFYNLVFPSIELAGFNWNRLINDGELLIPGVHAAEPSIDVHYIRANADANARTGDYPNQLMLEVGLKTNIEKVNIKNGRFRYTEVTAKGDEGTIEFSGIHSSFANITNLPAIIAHDNYCAVKLEGKYMNKSPLAANFKLYLNDKKGHFTMDGYLDSLNGNDVQSQAAVFTIVKVTSFKLNRMDMHIEGDETYSKGDFTVLYDDLKISLFKFDSKQRETRHGPFAFVGSALLLYPSNPMPGKDVRKVTTSFARDTTKGFVGTIWQNMFRSVKKSAIRDQGIVTLTDGPETAKGQQPKKGFFTRLFGKKKGRS